MAHIITVGAEYGITIAVAAFVGIVVFALLVIALSKILGGGRKRRRHEKTDFTDGYFDDDLK